MWKWILIVVVLALALGGVVLFRSESARLQDKDWRLAAIGAGIVAHQVDMYRQANGELPAELRVLTEAVAGRKAGRKALAPADLVDPWGRPYRYERSGRVFTIVSEGRDGRPGGEGPDRDIRVGDGHPLSPLLK
jgi:general secretion pathway protein G